jgi:hypothetical protein
LISEEIKAGFNVKDAIDCAIEDDIREAEEAEMP